MNKLILLCWVFLLIPVSAVADYFNTHRSQKIFGIFLTDNAQIDEVHAYSNAFGFSPRTAKEITEYLDANQSKLLPVIKINHLLLDERTGIYHHDVTEIIHAIKKSDTNHREILFLMDEPLWSIRTECKNKNKSAACAQITKRYNETLVTLRLVGQLLRAELPGSGMIHIESWSELVIQKTEHPNENVIMLDDAEYLGFDCYGDANYCGSHDHGYRPQVEYGTWVWETMMALESHRAIGRKLFLIPGSFLADGHFNDVNTVLNQLGFYAWVLQQSDKIGGFGTFLWGDMIEENTYFTGARHIEPIANLLAFISRVSGIYHFTEQQWSCIASSGSCVGASAMSSELITLRSESSSLPIPPSLSVYSTIPHRPHAP